MAEKLTPEEVARLDPFGVRKIPASGELAELLKKEKRKKEKSKELPTSPDWTKSLIKKERRALKQFFGKEIGVPPLPVEITPERLRHWEKLEMKLHYLPPIEMTQEKNFPGWKAKPEDDFFEWIEKGYISSEATQLPGKWVLVDTRDKPIYEPLISRYYLYVDDFLSPIIDRLRESEKLGLSHGIKGIRNLITWKEYHDILVPEIAKILGVKPKQVRLPRAIEFNFFGNIYYRQWAETRMSELFEDRYEDNYGIWGYLSGGDWFGCDPGPLRGVSQVQFRQVDWRHEETRDFNIGFRPLVEF